MLLGDICTEYWATDGEEEEEEEEEEREEDEGGSDGEEEGGGSCGDNGDDNEDEGDGDEGETKWGADEVDMLNRVTDGVPPLLLEAAAPLLAGSLPTFEFPLADSICWAEWWGWRW